MQEYLSGRGGGGGGGVIGLYYGLIQHFMQCAEGQSNTDLP